VRRIRHFRGDTGDVLKTRAIQERQPSVLESWIDMAMGMSGLLTLLEDGGAVDLYDRVFVFVLLVVGHDARLVAPLAERHKQWTGSVTVIWSKLPVWLRCPLGLGLLAWSPASSTRQLEVGGKLAGTPTSRDAASRNLGSLPKTLEPPSTSPAHEIAATWIHARYHQSPSTTPSKTIHDATEINQLKSGSRQYGTS